MNRREVEIAFEKVDSQSGWMTRYNVEHKYSSPYRVHEVMRSISYLPGSLKSLEAQLKRVLLHYFDAFAVEVWLEQNVDPLVRRVDEINDRAVALTASVSWPRRPIIAVASLKDRKLDDAETTEVLTTTVTSTEDAISASTKEDLSVT